VNQFAYDELERLQALARRLSAMAFVMVLAGIALVLVRPGRNPQVTLGLGICLVVLGVAMGFWALRGDLSEPSAERLARQQARLRPVMLAFRALELLLLSLAVLGLLLPEQFGSYWREHRFIVLIVSAGLLANVISRGVRYLAARRAHTEDAEPAA
jgi:DMSO reductase anchor subunit